MKAGSSTAGAAGHSAAGAALGATAGAGAGEQKFWSPLGWDPTTREDKVVIPDEMVVHILSFLDRRSLGRLTQVSSRGYALVQERLNRNRGYNDVSIYDTKLLMERFVQAAKPYPINQDRLKALLLHHRQLMHRPGVSNDDLIKSWRICLHRWPLRRHVQNKQMLVELFKNRTIDDRTLGRVLSLTKARILDADKFRYFIEDMLTNDDIPSSRKAVVFKHYISVADDAKRMNAFILLLEKYVKSELSRSTISSIAGSLSRVRLTNSTTFCDKLKSELLSERFPTKAKGIIWIIFAKQSNSLQFLEAIKGCMELMHRGLFSGDLFKEMTRNTFELSDTKKAALNVAITVQLKKSLVPIETKKLLWPPLKAEYRATVAMSVLKDPGFSDEDKQLAWIYFLQTKPKLVERVKAHLKTLLMGGSFTGFSKGGVAVIVLMLVAVMAYALRYVYLAGLENRYDQWNPKVVGDRCVLDMQGIRKHIAKNRGKTAEEIQSFKDKWGYYQEGFDAAQARQIRPGDRCFLTKRQVDQYLKALWKQSSNWEMKLSEFRELNGRGYIGGWKDAMALWFMKG